MIHNVEPVPAREPGEVDAAYAARLSTIYYEHCSWCDDCNYDRECVACAADGEYGPTSHSCNCGEHGWGQRTYDTVRRLEEKFMPIGLAPPNRKTP